MKMSEILVFRVSPELKQALQLEASRLNVRLVDVLRWAVARAVSQPNHGRFENSYKNEQEEKV